MRTGRTKKSERPTLKSHKNELLIEIVLLESSAYHTTQMRQAAGKILA
jgi:hypothetical protein